eukprot:8089179-Pyramimonas_sp.AAC.1
MSVQRRFHGVVRCCADDVGGLIRTAKGLRWAELLAGPVFKSRKCKAAPLGGPFAETRRARVLEQLRRASPEWGSFQVADSLLYLGFVLGPGASLASNWTRRG